MRPLRLFPEGGALVEVTTRTVQGRPLLRPTPELRDIILGVLGRAQEEHPLDIICFSFLSTHYHAILRVPHAKRLVDFMCYFNSNLAREVNRLTGWTGSVWSRRYRAIVISSEERAQCERFEYVLANGVKENLVAQVREWPGAHAVHALLDDQPLVGTWFDRTRELSARNRRESFAKDRYATRMTITLTPLPCWSHLTSEQRKQRITDMVARIEKEATLQRRETGARPLGVAAILAQNPETRPERLKTSPAPLFHTATKKVRQELRDAYALLVCRVSGCGRQAQGRVS